MLGYELIIPQALLLVGALQALFAGRRSYSEKAAARFGALCAVAAGMFILFIPLNVPGPFGERLVFDELARLVQIITLVLVVIWLLWTSGGTKEQSREAISLVLFTAIGALFLAEAREMITVIVSLELSTLPAYVLLGYKRGDIRNLEGALKYFLFSMLTTLFTMFGFSYLYGLSGTTFYSGLSLAGGGMVSVFTISLVLVGLFAKVSATPFHFWAPDAYVGSSPWIIAFISTVPKVAGTIAIVRLLGAVSAGFPELPFVVGAVAAASMIVGNLGALLQSDLRRLMAYFRYSPCRVSFAWCGCCFGGRHACLSSVCGCVRDCKHGHHVCEWRRKGHAVCDFQRLSSKASCCRNGELLRCFFPLSVIPPLAGFFGKLYLFMGALEQGQLVLVILAVIMSVVSAAYYLRIVRAMFFEQSEEQDLLETSNIHSAMLALCVLLVVVVGLTFGLLINTVIVL